MVRGRGYVKTLDDIEQIVVKTDERRHAGARARRRPRSRSGPDMRRGIADLDGKGDVVGGIVVMRQGENALNVIERVKSKLEELKPSLPTGVRDRRPPTTAPS